MAVIDRDYITSRSIYDKMFCTTLFWCSLKRPSVKLTKLLVRCLNAPWKSFYINLAFERLAFVTFWKLIHSHAVTPRWLDDGKECIQSVWSEQRDCTRNRRVESLTLSSLFEWRALLFAYNLFYSKALSQVTVLHCSNGLLYHSKHFL